jgi:hypothetical protein
MTTHFTLTTTPDDLGRYQTATISVTKGEANYARVSGYGDSAGGYKTTVEHARTVYRTLISQGYTLKT